MRESEQASEVPDPRRPIPEGGLASELYAELRAMAGVQARRGRLLRPTALVHEAWVRLAESQGRYTSRAHFLAAASLAMRCVLADHARAARALRRGEGRSPEGLTGVSVEERTAQVDLLVLDEALEKLTAYDARKAEVVTMRFLLGCTVEETAQGLGLSPATVKREWQFARAWLYRELEADAS